ncbi:hypothetical protein MP31_20710 [Escherichia coli N36254PS]|nr:hypothetical protein FORC41_0790 [Escherichia coli]ERF92885.1 hypothetical protein CFSAN002237_14115 [Escherichia coli O104:H21 str. CFSAN002237]OMI66623.1 hypothetical protein MP31_20710 [Escherichia coli N36254PS]EFI3576873.1 hypothetical protein [Escherichia coli]EFI3728040.1 hypothetical protein [Escherichia coli]
MIFESFTICIIFPYLQVESMVYVENAWISRCVTSKKQVDKGCDNKSNNQINI